MSLDGPKGGLMSIEKMGEVSGVLNLSKPGGMTSRDVVDLVSRPLRKVKVGHAGTLDPLASGVLVVCVGSATRLIEYVQRMPKAYRTVVRLGARSDTLDADGRVVVEEAPRGPTGAEVLEALATQAGTIDQVPPQFSALKVEGKRAYDLARSGQGVELAARPVRIDRVELLSYAWPLLELQVDCGSGTYIRSIARDVGEALGCGGLVEVLVRTRIGPFLLDDAIDPIGQSIEALLAHLQPTVAALGDLPRLALSVEQVLAIGMGKALAAKDVEGAEGLEGEAGLIGPDGDLVAVADVGGPLRAVRPRRVLAARN
jgi:tRNA pseudouridine55 synthase